MHIENSKDENGYLFLGTSLNLEISRDVGASKPHDIAAQLVQVLSALYTAATRESLSYANVRRAHY